MRSLRSFTLRYLIDLASYAMDDEFVTLRDARAIQEANKFARAELEKSYEKQNLLRQESQRRWDDLMAMTGERNAARTKNLDLTNRNIELRTKLDGAEAQLKYAGSFNPFDLLPMHQQMYQVRGGEAYKYDPRTMTVQVPVRDITNLTEKANAFRYPRLSEYCSGQAQAQCRFDRDTIEVTRNLWQDIHDQLSRLKSFRRDVLFSLDVQEGEDPIAVANQVKRTNLSLLSEKSRLLKLQAEAIADAQTVKEEITNLRPQAERLEKENTDLRSTLRQMNRTYEQQLRKISLYWDAIVAAKDTIFAVDTMLDVHHTSPINAVFHARRKISEWRNYNNLKPTTGEIGARS